MNRCIRFAHSRAWIQHCLTQPLTVVLFLLLMTGMAAAQQQTINVQGGGTLTFQMAHYYDYCGSSHSFYVNEWDFSNFVYTDTTGGTYSMPGFAAAFEVTGDNRDNCPTPPPSSPVQLNQQGILITFYPGDGYATATLGPISGILSPKYIVLAVTYAPPGASSYVNYSNSTSQSTSTSVSKTFTDQTSLSVTMGASTNFGIFAADTSATASTSYSQEKDSSSSVALSTTTTYGRQIPGPSSSAQGVNHAYDIIWVWLNPLVNMSINPDNSLNWNGYSYDSSDINEMDIVPLYVTWLQNPQTMPADVVNVLARSWDTSGTGGLTTADYATILARDPMLNASFNPNTDASGRFDLQAGHDFNYVPPPAGGQPVTETYSLSTQATSTAGQGSSDTYQVGLGFDLKFKTGLFFAKVKTEIKVDNTATWVNKWSSLSTSTSGQQASLSVTGPATSDNYTGPTRFEVWRDNVYGTFMFYPVN